MKWTAVVIAMAMLGSLAAHADLPPNNLHLFDNVKAPSNISEEQFNLAVDTVIAAWQPLAKQHGAVLEGIKKWNDATVNAYAQQQGNTWKVTMFGGLARRPEVTLDGFILVICHELGHHFGGYYFYESNWASAEGQADYFATQVCARKVFSKATKRNHYYRLVVPQYVKERCDASWKTPEAQDLCYRSAAGGLSLATLLATLGREAAPKFETPDPKVVTKTNTAHPAAQCRLDTYFNGGLCAVPFDLTKIPGKEGAIGKNTPAAEADAAKYSCFASTGHKIGNRPNCWFKAAVASFRRR